MELGWQCGLQVYECVEAPVRVWGMAGAFRVEYSASRRELKRKWVKWGVRINL